MFEFKDVMVIFLAVMFTDIILLDAFNTLGLPTSTTVAVVFELLGASIAMALIKITYHEIGAAPNLGDYINSAKALGIISGILVSVVIAFTFGVIVQALSRMVFTFNYEKTMKYFGAIWGGMAVASITYFMLIKGAKGASFIHPDTLTWITNNTGLLLLSSFIIWALLLQLLNSLFKVNILKIIVLLGTFALAMAFAGNDLVNFIGVPLAGLESFKLYQASGESSMMMVGLSQAVKTPTLYLLIAGLVMILTLWFSKKAKSVTKTSVNLSRQDMGYERFGSNQLSRSIVRFSVKLVKFIEVYIPTPVSNWLEKRFERLPENENENNDKPAFDLIRASVNLVLSSVLIALGTSLKLPLSTTYVTFMVAMGSSLADGAWGRESAVYRVSGVISVIGGWFLTALVALTVSMFFASVIYFGGVYSIGGIVLLSVIFVLRTQIIHKRREQEEKTFEEEFAHFSSKKSAFMGLIGEYNQKISIILTDSVEILEKIFTALNKEDRKSLQKQLNKLNKIDDETKMYKNNVHEIIAASNEADTEKVHYFVQVVDYLREYVHALSFIIKPAKEHIENNHVGLSKKQTEELQMLNQEYKHFVQELIKSLETLNFKNLSDLKDIQQNILENINASRLQQLKRVKQKSSRMKNSILFIDILTEFKNLTLFSFSMVKIEAAFKDQKQKN
jgi:phosphate/sulfate permease